MRGVQARNCVGESGWSDVGQYHTDAAVPSQPDKPEVSLLGPQFSRKSPVISLSCYHSTNEQRDVKRLGPHFPTRSPSPLSLSHLRTLGLVGLCLSALAMPLALAGHVRTGLIIVFSCHM